jgi:hypothetical protein
MLLCLIYFATQGSLLSYSTFTLIFWCQASSPANLAAPPGYPSDKGSLHGQHDLEPLLDQMFLGADESFDTNSSAPGQQHYNTGLDSTQSPNREDELDAIACIHHQSQYQDPGFSLQDAVGSNDGRYLQVLPSAPWNSVAAAYAFEPTHMTGSYQTPPKQSRHMVSDSDEGYYTLGRSQGTRSVISDRSGSIGRAITNLQATPRSIPESQRIRAYSQGQAGNGSMASQQTTTRRAPRSEPELAVSNISCNFERCDWTGKTQSDLKKHRARHDRSHICEHADCVRNGKGFATVNDLQRHRKSVHNFVEASDRYYRCFARGCSKSQKNWPRKDNFCSHLRKTHPAENVDQLVKLSENWWNSREPSVGLQTEAPEIRVHDYPDSSVPHLDYSQQTAHPPTPYPASSDSSLAHSRSLSQAPFLNPSWVPQDFTYNPNSIPHTPQPDRQQYAPQQAQAMVREAYHSANTYPAFSSSLQSPRRMQQAGNNYLRNQQRPRSQRTSMSNASLYPPHAAQGGQTSAQSHAHTPLTRQAVVAVANQMSRTASVNYPNLLSQGQGPGVGPSWRTDADFPSLQEERRREMTQMPESRPSEAANFPDFVNPADDLAQIGWVADSYDYPGSASSGGMMHQNLPQTLAADQSQINDSPELSVEQIKNFLEMHANKTESDEVKDTLTSLLRSLHSRSGGGPSTEEPRLEVNTDDLIEETTYDSGKAAFRCKWERCGSCRKLWSLRSEIKKHIKRHTKPFGCTFENCYKRFGSKSDWMRHEVKRHQQQECWRCDIANSFPAPGLQPCRKTFGKKEQFTHHLQQFHQITDAREVNPLVTKQHINSCFQPQYWCGFCREILKLSHKGKLGYHERYDHVANHISVDEKSIDDWYPPDGKYSKREILARKTQPGLVDPDLDDDDGDADRDEDEHEISPEGSTGESSQSATSPPEVTSAPSSAQRPHHRPSSASAAVFHLDQFPPQSGNSNKRSASTAGLQQSQQNVQRRANFWRCDRCGYENLAATSPACLCGHRRCDGCEYFWRRTDEE